jgi:hypothetical protein
MQYREEVVDYYEKHRKQRTALFRKTAELINVKAGSTYSNHGTTTSEKKTKLKAEPLTHQLHC